MDNIQIEADLWLSCGECLNEIDEQGNVNSPKEYAKFQVGIEFETNSSCLLYTSPSPRDKRQSRMPSSA